MPTQKRPPEEHRQELDAYWATTNGFPCVVPDNGFQDQFRAHLRFPNLY